MNVLSCRLERERQRGEVRRGSEKSTQNATQSQGDKRCYLSSATVIYAQLVHVGNALSVVPGTECQQGQMLVLQKDIKLLPLTR